MCKVDSCPSFPIKHQVLLVSLEQLHNMGILANNQGYLRFSRREGMTATGDDPDCYKDA